jgi:hypothetical protein
LGFENIVSVYVASSVSWNRLVVVRMAKDGSGESDESVVNAGAGGPVPRPQQ